MDDEPEVSEDRIREMGKKEFRKEFPSGWMEITRYETLVLVVDALLEAPGAREYTQKELASKAGTAEKSVDNHISTLVDIGVLQKLEKDREEARYTLNNQSPITHKLYELNDTVNRVKDGDLPKTVVGGPDSENTNQPNSISDESRFTMPNYTKTSNGSGTGFQPIADDVTG